VHHAKIKKSNACQQIDLEDSIKQRNLAQRPSETIKERKSWNNRLCLLFLCMKKLTLFTVCQYPKIEHLQFPHNRHQHPIMKYCPNITKQYDNQLPRTVAKLSQRY